MVAHIVDKYGNAIQEGDSVFKIRGGSHEGKVCRTQRMHLYSRLHLYSSSQEMKIDEIG
jgi:hypothetical protein